MSSTEKKNVALVLGSGGARGLAQIGVIEELERRGYSISSIAGTSIGSVIGGVYAAGALNEYKDWVLQLDRRNVFGLMDFTLASHGFIKGERVFESMRKFIPVTEIEDLSIPYAAVAVDLENQSEVVFKSGDLWKAIRASVAIPSVMTPVIKDDKVLVDGGVVNPLPVNRVKRTEGDLLIAVDLNALVPGHPVDLNKEEKNNKERSAFLESVRQRIGDWWPWSENGEDSEKSNTEENKSRVKRNFLGILSASFELMQDQLAQWAMHQSPPDVLIQIPRKSADTFDFYLGKQLIELGAELASQALDKYESENKKED